MLPPTERFSSRVENYVKYRPSYPRQVVETLESECGLTPEAIVADVGSGTGILAALLLEHGNEVYGVEPNLEMRSAAEALLRGSPRFRSVEGTAENTTLKSGSVDVVVAGQAFHWFEPVATRREFKRILKPGGWVVLVWNRRPTSSNEFQEGYEELLHLHAPEYPRVTNERVDADALARFFAPNRYAMRHFPNLQEMDLESFRGRMLSSSYTPLKGQPGHEEIMTGLDELFARYSHEGLVRFEYVTEVFFGQLD